MNLPNILSLFRLFLVPCFALTYMSDVEHAGIYAGIIFMVAAITDVIDGYLARKWNQITSFGKLFDPLADKLIVLTVLYCLADTGYVPWFVFWLMIGKEAFLVIGALGMLGKKVVVKSNIFGKAATCLFIAAIALVYPWHASPAVFAVGNIMIYVALAASLLAMGIYAWEAVKIPSKS